jgi:hypothetical protein
MLYGNVCFAPESGRFDTDRRSSIGSSCGGKFITGQFWTFATQSANRVLARRSKMHRYSITWSASKRNDSGIESPSALAVLRLTRSAKFGRRLGWRRQWLRRKYPDAPHMRALLRLRRERPCRHTAEQRDEIASSH